MLKISHIFNKNKNKNQNKQLKKFASLRAMVIKLKNVESQKTFKKNLIIYNDIFYI